MARSTARVWSVRRLEPRLRATSLQYKVLRASCKSYVVQLLRSSNEEWLRRIRAAFVMADLGHRMGPRWNLHRNDRDPDGSMDEPWWRWDTPRLLGGVVFSAVLGLRRAAAVNELSLLRVGAWGSVAGLLVGLLPFVWGSESQSPGMAAGCRNRVCHSMSAVSAAASLALARRQRRENCSTLHGRRRCGAEPR